MEQNIFSAMEIDAIGEIMNISLGSSATAASNMLDHRVDITTPTVSVMQAEDFMLGDLEPAIAVVIKYVTGLEGSNIMLLKRSDIKVIVDVLMGSETPDEEFELNELTISAVCELMNQMMGSASTALSDFLGRMVNISTPESYELNDLRAFKEEHFPVKTGPVVVVRFKLSIEGALESEFINVISISLARELMSSFGLGEDMAEESTPAPEPEPAPEPSDGGTLSQAMIDQLTAGGAATAPESADTGGGVLSQAMIDQMTRGGAPATPPPAADGGTLSQAMIDQMTGGGMKQPEPAPATVPQPQPIPPQPQPGGQMPPPGYEYPPMWGQGVPGAYPQMPYYPYPPQVYPQPDPKVIPTKPPEMPHLNPMESLGEEQAQNLDLIMSVPLEISVEIGRTRRKVQEILSFSKGSLVVLDKLAGDQVDLFVNGKCIAKGDVVVVDDNFGIRITEILQKPGLEEMTKA